MNEQKKQQIETWKELAKILWKNDKKAYAIEENTQDPREKGSWIEGYIGKITDDSVIINRTDGKFPNPYELYWILTLKFEPWRTPKREQGDAQKEPEVVKNQSKAFDSQSGEAEE